MSLVMTRVDARLIHGQVALRWTKVSAATKIVVVDNKTAKDEFLKEVLMMAKPQGVDVVIYDEDTAVSEWQKDQFKGGNVFLLFQNIEGAHRCYENGIHYESINIGQAPKGKNTRRCNNTVHVTDQDIAALDDLASHGVRVYFNPTPEDVSVEWEQASRKLR